MSQITRCPSCATSFKVVADQLRISEGWVRCGQCKEVFDATAHLVSTVEPLAAPEGSFSFVPEHTPLDATDGVTEAEQVAIHRQGDGAKEPVSPSPEPAQYMAATADFWGHDAAATLPHVPLPTLLDADVGGMSSVDRAGRGPEKSAAGGESVWETPLAESLLKDAAAEFAPKRTVDSLGLEDAQAVRPESVLAPWLRGRGDAQTIRGHHVDVPWHDSGFSEPKSHTPAASTFAEEAVSSDSSLTARFPVLSGDDGLACEAVAVDTAVVELQLNRVSHEAFERIDRAINPAPENLEQSNAPTEIVREERLKLPPTRVDEDDEDNFSDLDQDVGFVVAARHKAIWRSPVVRAMLSLVLLLCVLALALQVAVHERDRIAAMDVRAKPFLMRLCEAFGCNIAPQRQIAQVVIDSSSFNKLRGDSYQLVFVMKNRASSPVATPALELTLTDTQDQPVLRKVLLPGDFTAPIELAARGEWDASVSVVVTTGGARVIGYRLLAFYP